MSRFGILGERIFQTQRLNIVHWLCLMYYGFWKNQLKPISAAFGCYSVKYRRTPHLSGEYYTCRANGVMFAA